MADEALRELLEEWRGSLKAREDMLLVEGMDVDDPVTGYRGDPDYYRRNNVIAGDMRARVNALESALSELARLRAEMEVATPVIYAARLLVAADTYKHPVLSRADAVKAGVAELHDAVQRWQSAQPAQRQIQSHEEKQG